MKYRRLHLQELEAVKDEFVKFLASNSIVADDWESIKKQSPDKAESLLEIFSDIFWDKVLEKIKSLEIRRSHSLKVFHFGEKKAEVVELRLPATSAVDLTDQNDLRGVAEGTIDLAGQNPELYTGSKEYGESREQEVFGVLESGATPCNEKLFYGLKAMIQKNKD
jgi:hypothetical protein